MKFTGVYEGESDPDKSFCGDKLNVSDKVVLYRCAGMNGFSDVDINISGQVNDDWVDLKLRFGVSSDS